jgi:peptidoglycan/LPS O-acetylase OafA/YrhL
MRVFRLPLHTYSATLHQFRVSDVQYRHEIDGLRTVAVVPVILFHAGLTLFSGGYVGVDIFFVISGYLITTIIASEIDQGRFSIVNFYERRIRRILPALFFVILVTLPFAYLWMLPHQLKDFGQSLLAIAFFASNILFWRESDYFDIASEQKPFLHTWSLAVEEQYYIFFPLVLLALWRYGRNPMLYVIIALSLISLAGTEWLRRIDATANFYLIPTRAWELLAGSICALLLLKTDPKKNEVLSLAGLMMILASIFLYDEHTPFPSFYTVLPVLGTALIILYATAGTLTARLLSGKAMVGLGLISYSTYLWHQPLFAFARIRSLEEPGLGLMMGLSVASFVLAFVSWKFIEAPFRNRSQTSRRVIFSFALIGTIALLGLGAVLHKTNGFATRMAAFSEIYPLNTYRQNQCHWINARTPEQIADGDICTYGPDAAPDLAIIGDSHAGALFKGFAKQAEADGLSFYAVSGGYCAPLKNRFRLKSIVNFCPDLIENAMAKFAELDTLKTVVLVAEWANYTQGFRDDGAGKIPAPSVVLDATAEAGSPAENPALFERSLRETIRFLQVRGKRVILVAPTPEFHEVVGDHIQKIALWSGSQETGLRMAPQITRAQYVSRTQEVTDIFARLDGVDVVEVADLFCTDEICSSIDPQSLQILFSDSNHVTLEGAQIIADRLLERIEAR